MKKKRSPRTVIASVVTGLLVFALLGYFVLIRPQRSEAQKLSEQIAATEQQIAERQRALAEAKQQAPPIRVADLFRLTKAMPDEEDIAGVLLELNGVAADAGITFESITPQRPVALTGYAALPINVIFNGDFYSLSDFLYRLRTLVHVDDGRLAATGRLFAIDTLDFAESQEGFPKIAASLVVDAFVYGTGAPATATPTTATTTVTTSTSPLPEADPASAATAAPAVP